MSFLIAIAVIFVVILLALKYFGQFRNVVVNVGSPPYPLNGQTIAYKKHMSSIYDSSQHFKQVCRLVPTLHSFGIYFDEPNDDNKYKSRFLIGVILDAKSQEFESQKRLLETNGYILGEMPNVSKVVSTVFPFRTFLSIIIAVKKVYPKLKSYIAGHKLKAHPAIEVFARKQMYFMFALDKHQEFSSLYGIDDNSRPQ